MVWSGKELSKENSFRRKTHNGLRAVPARPHLELRCREQTPQCLPARGGIVCPVTIHVVLRVLQIIEPVHISQPGD